MSHSRRLVYFGLAETHARSHGLAALLDDAVVDRRLQHADLAPSSENSSAVWLIVELGAKTRCQWARAD